MSSRNYDSSAPSLASASHRLNRRFTAYVDQVFERQMRQRRRLLLAVSIIVMVLFALIAFAVLQRMQDLWAPFLIAGLLIAAWATRGIQGLFRWRQRTQQMRAVIQTGTPVNAFLVQANGALLHAQRQTLPCLVLISFQPEVSGEIDYMQSLARRVYALKNTQPTDADSQFVAGLTTNERAVPGRRRLLPLSFTDGSTIYCADLLVRPDYLQGSHIQSDILPCIAEPGLGGGIELVPWWLLQEPEKPLTPFQTTEGSRLGL
ncbi:MAG: hypothetical protein V4671_04230 [Armatimonadota bacterium]